MLVICLENGLTIPKIPTFYIKMLGFLSVRRSPKNLVSSTCLFSQQLPKSFFIVVILNCLCSLRKLLQKKSGPF